MGMESGRAETEATIHTVRGQLESFLADVELAKLHWVSFALNLVLHELALLDECLEHEWQDSVFGLGACLFG